MGATLRLEWKYLQRRKDSQRAFWTLVMPTGNMILIPDRKNLAAVVSSLFLSLKPFFYSYFTPLYTPFFETNILPYMNRQYMDLRRSPNDQTKGHLSLQEPF